MADKIKNTAVVESCEALDKDIYSIWLKDKEVAALAVPGQFINVYCNDGTKVLPRPISICDVDKENGKLRIVFRVAGEGTKQFSSLKAEDKIEILGPLGNGFTKEGSKAILIGGGIGIPPMLLLAKELNCEKTIVLGYRDSLFMKDEFEKYGKVIVSTEDGSFGTKGNVIDAIKENNVTGDIIFACGPKPMLKGVKAFAQDNNITAQISMEERMACGIGACLACVCKSAEKDHHTNVNNKRICKDGPVFYAQEVEL